MLINQKTMMSPMVSGPTLFNRLKANKGLTKALQEELWSLQTVSDLCQDICLLFYDRFDWFPQRGVSLYLPVVWGRVSWLVRHSLELVVEC